MSFKIKRALISVTSKVNLDILLETLAKDHVEIISTGGTLKKIKELGYMAKSISDYTNQAEILDGRVKTLDYKVYAALLFDRNNPNHKDEIKKLNIEPIDLVVCNLYPFEEVAKETDDLGTLIENIDIGGPTMLRASAKNFQNVCVLSDPSFYQEFIEQYNNGISEEFRAKMAIAVFNTLEKYNQQIAFKLDTTLKTQEVYTPLRYGENSHQKAWLKQSNLEKNTFTQLHGKELSYNNLIDMDAAIHSCYQTFQAISSNKQMYSVSIIKHNNPCGLAINASKTEAIINAWNGDNKSAFGSIICMNFEIDEHCAAFFEDKFVEVIMAPNFTHDALHVLKKKKNLRLISIKEYNANMLEKKSVLNGELIQEFDSHLDHEFQIVTKTNFNDLKNFEDENLLKFGSACAKLLKSNAICFVEEKNGGYWLAGAGMGQPNRIDSMQLLAHKRLIDNGSSISNTIMISDAFFPFRDSIDCAAKLGVKMIIQPGGSIKDKEVIEACNEHEIAMAFTNYRHFKH